MAIDIGVKNLAVCVLSTTCGRCKVPLEELAARVERMECLHWGVHSVESKRLTSGQLDAAIAWFTSQRQLFEVDVVVIEQQMTARMKALSVALYTCIKLSYPDAGVYFQSASKKLSWRISDLFQDYSLKSYYQRKQTAVRIASHLISTQPRMVAVWDQHKKKDDLADSLLHALAFLFT